MLEYQPYYPQDSLGTQNIDEYSCVEFKCFSALISVRLCLCVHVCTYILIRGGRRPPATVQGTYLGARIIFVKE